MDLRSELKLSLELMEYCLVDLDNVEMVKQHAERILWLVQQEQMEAAGTNVLKFKRAA